MTLGMGTGAGPSGGDAARLMDRMYRVQRHIYDLTRKYYLLGRDRLIAGLDVPPGGTVLELGCGTGRNLVSVARAYPQARLFGADISEEMLKSARVAIARADLTGRIRVARGDATDFDAATSFGITTYDRVYFSYALSMIPDWQAAMHEGWRLTRPGGLLALVDFGDCAGLPAAVKVGLRLWLKPFHVTPRDELPTLVKTIAAHAGTDAIVESHRCGYAQLAQIRKA